MISSVIQRNPSTHREPTVNCSPVVQYENELRKAPKYNDANKNQTVVTSLC